MNTLPSTTPKGRIKSRTRHALQAVALGTTSTLLTITGALAQASSSSGSIGAQLNKMSSEGIDSGGNIATFACYGLALLVGVAGTWALWQSRQPQNREGGRVAMGIAGLVLAGLFATVPNWVNKASNTVAGNDASVNNTPGQIQFKP